MHYYRGNKYVLSKRLKHSYSGSEAACVSVSVCLCVNHGGTDHNRYT